MVTFVQEKDKAVAPGLLQHQGRGLLCGHPTNLPLRVSQINRSQVYTSSRTTYQNDRKVKEAQTNAIKRLALAIKFVEALKLI